MSSASAESLAALPDLNACEREQLQFAGAIEPHGLLLVLSPDLRIAQTSSNSLQYLGVPPQALLQKRLGDILTQEDSDRLTSGTLNEGKRRYVSYIHSASDSVLFDGLVHRNKDLLIVELEPQTNPSENRDNLQTYPSLTDAMSEIGGRVGLVELCEHIAKRIRQVTGFDRVMVYRFLEDNSGSVLAEERREDLAPFLGLRYPASDIPSQARRLYLLNTLRLKPDVNAVRSVIVPQINPHTGAMLDMSFCILRAMSPVHDEYLRNMGVSASMSISIIKDGRLWGLIACHHTQPRQVPHTTRITCEVLARVFSSSIAAAEDEDRRARAASLAELIHTVTVQLRKLKDVTATLKAGAESIRSAMKAEGAAFYVRGELYLIGITPSSVEAGLLIRWLAKHQKEHLFTMERLTLNYPKAAEFANPVSGLLSLRIALEGPDFILWFRPAVVKEINWAGSPETVPPMDAGSERISPRRSFELWKQTVRDSGEPWDDTDQQFARAIRHVLAEALLLQVNDDVSRLNIELSRSNIELNSFAYAASHDLQEPLRVIRSFAQLIARGEGKDFKPETREFLNIIDSSAGRMGNLITSLLSYSELGGTERRQRKPVNVEDVLRWAVMDLQDMVQESGAKITHDALPSVQADHQHLVRLLQNLISNSLKYRRSDCPLQVHLSASLETNVWRFTVRDNGEGFDPEHKELIFQAFKRLHGGEVPGSGIGLATCKRIVELNGGKIWAESAGKGKGATFSFTVPSGDMPQVI